MNKHGSVAWTSWADRIPDQRWEIYRRIIERAKQQNIPFALGGGFATGTHTGRFRVTKDMDLYTLEQHGPEFKSSNRAATMAPSLWKFFSNDPNHLIYSRDMLRAVWQAAACQRTL